jgi:hypothetical protein
MDFEIIPFERVGSVHFGMTPEEVQQAFSHDLEWQEIRSDSEAHEFSANYSSLKHGISFSFHKIDGDYYCTTIFMYFPANPTFNGRSLIRQKGRGTTRLASNLKDWLSTFDNDIVAVDPYNTVDENTLFRGLGIQLYQPPWGPASVLVYAKDYMIAQRV